MARSLRFPLRHWVIFGGSFTAVVISMIAVVVSLRFYRSRTGELPGFTGSGIVAASPSRAAPPAGKVAPAAAVAEFQPPLEEPKEKMVFLAAPPPIQTLQGGISYEMLRREIVRQAFLLSARDEFGLSTRDGASRDSPSKPLPVTSQFQIDSHIIPAAKTHVLVE